jgi:hypothetical protein
MFLAFADLERARLPAAALGRLAALRCEPRVQVALHDRELWIRWDTGRDDVARSLLPLSGCRLYGRHNGRWHAWGEALPAFDVPEALRFRPVYEVVFPAAMHPISAGGRLSEPVALALVPDSVFRPTHALECPLDSFLAWADSVPSCALARYQGAIQEQRLLVLGNNLPWLEDGERFWGRSVLVPIGFRPQPFLVEADLRRAAGIDSSDLLILRSERSELVATDQFSYLTHAALRLARAEATS